MIHTEPVREGSSCRGRFSCPRVLWYESLAYPCEAMRLEQYVIQVQGLLSKRLSGELSCRESVTETPKWWSKCLAWIWEHDGGYTVPVCPSSWSLLSPHSALSPLVSRLSPASPFPPVNILLPLHSLHQVERHSRPIHWLSPRPPMLHLRHTLVSTPGLTKVKFSPPSCLPQFHSIPQSILNNLPQRFNVGSSL